MNAYFSSLGSNDTCYINENTLNISNGHDLNETEFKKSSCAPWCPSQNCPICANISSFSNHDVISCGHDNMATQMGMEPACTKFNPNLNWGNGMTAVGCVCKEERCYCYCVIQDCVCDFGNTINRIRIIDLLFVAVMQSTLLIVS